MTNRIQAMKDKNHCSNKDSCDEGSAASVAKPVHEGGNKPLLAIIGGGSAAFAATTRAVENGWRVIIFNDVPSLPHAE